MNKQRNKLIIIDGNALIHRSFHALPTTLRTKDGLLVNAVYGFTAFLLKALAEFKPEYIILTLDKAGPTFRHLAYAEYKATRVKGVDELYAQIPLVKEVATAFDIPIFEKSGYEADDIIGSLTKQAKREKNLETIIVTGDMDTLQLISDQAKVYTMSRGLSDSVLYDSDKVKERYKLSPKQIVDYKALAGDASDNIPGAKGIGAKTATDLLLSYKSIEGIYEAVEKKSEEIKPRTLQLLIESRDNVFLSKELATIDCDAPVKLSLEKASFKSPEMNSILELFQRFEFKSLLNKVRALSGDSEKLEEKIEISKKQKIQTVKINHHLINNESEISNLLKKINKEKTVGFYIETKPDSEEILGYAFALEGGGSFFIPHEKNFSNQIKSILENEKIKKIGYNLKLNFRILKTINIELKGIYFDILIAAYLLNPGNRRYQIENLIFTELGVDETSQASVKSASQATQLTLDLEVDLKALSKKACETVSYIFQLKPILENRLHKEALYDIFKNLEMPLTVVLGNMENNGIKINTKFLSSLEKEVSKKIEVLEKKIYKEAGKTFNINSTKQLKEILFTDLELPTKGIKKTKTGFSTAEDELNKLKELHPIISLMLNYRELSKLETTYLKALPKMINPKTNRIHTHFSQVVAATGRLSSHDPNLQNIPTKTTEGRRIRQAFVAEDGFVLVGFDYSQIELRLAAHFSKDKKMINSFLNKADIHTETAASINGITPKEVTHKMRQEAKAINFGILYGQGPHGLSQSAGIPYSQAQEFIKKYFITYPNIKKMVDGFIKEAERKGYASTLIGRKRPLPDINSQMPLVRKSSQRMAINTPIQGTAADLIKKAMIKVMALLAGKDNEIRLLLQVHDELIFEIKEDKIEKYSKDIEKIMQENTQLAVPITVERSSGKTWENLK
ncbi:MAG TPA: DNA polymerase I [Patescibacteria group bacterium]|nr:DNA polymerase I [Patescibacteria group bacterium]